MNWRHRVQEIVTGKKSDVVWVQNDNLKKIINKCRYKYSGFKDFAHRSMNSVNIINYYKVGNNVYKIETQINRKACGLTRTEKNSIQAFKFYYKKHIYNDYDKIPNFLNSGIDWRRSKQDGSSWVVWEYLENIGS